MTRAEYDDGFDEGDAWASDDGDRFDDDADAGDDADGWDAEDESEDESEFDDGDEFDDDADDEFDDDADDERNDDELDDDAVDDAADEFDDDADSGEAFENADDDFEDGANSVALDSLDSDNRVIFERLACGPSWTSAEKAKIQDVIRIVRRYAGLALAAARRLDTKMIKRRLKDRWESRPFGTFFGTGWFTRGRVRRIRRRVIKIAGLLLNSFRLVKVPNKSGSCNGRCWRGSFSGIGSAEAYTTSGGSRRIYLCPRYFTDGSQFATIGRSREQMARTLVHEMVHEIGHVGHRTLPGGGVVDNAKSSAELARKKPLRPGTNAESYAWFFFYNADLKLWRRHKKAKLL